MKSKVLFLMMLASLSALYCSPEKKFACIVTNESDFDISFEKIIIASKTSSKIKIPINVRIASAWSVKYKVPLTSSVYYNLEKKIEVVNNQEKLIIKNPDSEEGINNSFVVIKNESKQIIQITSEDKSPAPCIYKGTINGDVKSDDYLIFPNSTVVLEANKNQVLYALFIENNTLIKLPFVGYEPGFVSKVLVTDTDNEVFLIDSYPIFKPQRTFESVIHNSSPYQIEFDGVSISPNKTIKHKFSLHDENLAPESWFSVKYFIPLSGCISYVVTEKKCVIDKQNPIDLELRKRADYKEMYVVIENKTNLAYAVTDGKKKIPFYKCGQIESDNYYNPGTYYILPNSTVAYKKQNNSAFYVSTPENPLECCENMILPRPSDLTEPSSVYYVEITEDGVNFDGIKSMNDNIFKKFEKSSEPEKEANYEKPKKTREKKYYGYSGGYLYALFGSNAPFMACEDQVNEKLNASITKDCSLSLIFGGGFLPTLKYSLGWQPSGDLKELICPDISMFSAGISPVHNYRWFIGVYGSAASESLLDGYNYWFYGGSLSVLLNISRTVGVFFNTDCGKTYVDGWPGRQNGKPKPGYPAQFNETLRLSPSIGIFFRL